MKKLLALAALLAFPGSAAFAVNPVDSAAFHRMIPTQFYAVGYNGGDRFLFANVPVKKTVSAYLSNWQNADGDEDSTTLMVSKRFTSKLDMGLRSEVKVDEINNDLGIDLHHNRFGLGAIFPIRAENTEDIKISPRVKVAELITVYLEISGKGTDPSYGLTFKKWGVALDTAYWHDEGNHWVARLSKSRETKWGTFSPELWSEFAPDENIYGVILGFIPKSKKK